MLLNKAVLSSRNLSARIANTFEVDGLFQYGKPPAYVLRNFNIVKWFVMKIDNSPAFYTFEMLMSLKTAVKSLHIACALDGRSCTNLGQSQKCPVDRVQRYIGYHLSDTAKNHLRRRMLFRLNQYLINCHPLRRNFEPSLTTPPLEGLHFLFLLVVFSSIATAWHIWALPQIVSIV
jgi:hypothetical protein